MLATLARFDEVSTVDATPDKPELIDIVADIVSAYVSHNSLPQADLPALIGDVHRALSGAANPAVGETPAAEQAKLKPAEIRRSISPDHLVSFEDGKTYKSLKRHLAGRGLTPQQYREKWGLPADYPMVAPNYSAQRSALARSLGLGRKTGSGLAKVSAEDALRTEASEEAAESTTVEGNQDDLAEAAAPPTPARKPRAKKPKKEAAEA